MSYDLNELPVRFLKQARANYQNPIRNTSTGLYLDSALRRLEAMGKKEKLLRDYLQSLIGMAAKCDDTTALNIGLRIVEILDGPKESEVTNDAT